MPQTNDQINYILANLVEKTLTPTFYTFSTPIHKQWLMPKRHLSTALNLYQPSGVKGKLMKSLFPYLHWIGPVRSALKVSTSHYALQAGLRDLLQEIFHCAGIEFSIFEGTPSVHQKITMQVSCGRRILGYCKFSNGQEIKEIFRNEQTTLNTLRQKGITQIPECLYCGNLKDDIDIFVQTTAKTNSSKVIHQWSDCHTDFLDRLYRQTNRTIAFEKSDFFRTLRELKRLSANLNERQRKTIADAIKDVESHYAGENILFSAYHGDFTPWNTFVEQGRLFVFDWEYAKQSYPPYMDFFHFFTQTAIFERHWDTNQIFGRYISISEQLTEWIVDPELIYECYLLEFVALYLKRDKNISDPDTLQEIDKRIRLLACFS